MAARTTIEALARWLKDQDDILLMGHVSPDGDTTGSCLAILHALDSLGKRAEVRLPGGIANLYRFLPGADRAVDSCQAPAFEPKAVLAVDVSDFTRLGEGDRAVFEACGNTAVLDHHGTNPGFGGMLCLDAEAAATGEMALNLIEAMDVKLDKAMAECLYVAISTDCGQFQFSNTRPETLEAAARCVQAGADFADITSRLWRTRTLARTRLLAAVLSGLEISADGKMAWARLTEDMLAKANARREDNEGIVNYLLEIDSVVFAALAEQRGDKTKFSLRSAAPFDVAKHVALPLGGGGHDRAAGVTLDMDMESALKVVLSMAGKALG
ncbi:MAG: bifunctional oligoribonuclease/PAP phosphatase NrnA [Clostridia bacterium]|nr:bifunctional oligoribonuclease/PAP phosphatase NrnA [Clostridia bacterium]